MHGVPPFESLGDLSVPGCTAHGFIVAALQCTRRRCRVRCRRRPSEMDRSEARPSTSAPGPWPSRRPGPFATGSRVRADMRVGLIPTEVRASAMMVGALSIASAGQEPRQCSEVLMVYRRGVPGADVPPANRIRHCPWCGPDQSNARIDQVLLRTPPTFRVLRELF